jgi:hypothetical protein
MDIISEAYLNLFLIKNLIFPKLFSSDNKILFSSRNLNYFGAVKTA